MSSYGEEDIDTLIGLLEDDTEPIIVTTVKPARRYPIQQTFLRGVSSKLAESCDRIHNYPDIDDGAFRVFLAWLLQRGFDNSHGGYSQEEFARAWNFGLKYEIPAFQDAVMRTLVCILQNEDVCPSAILEAYKNVRATQLKRALIAQLAIDMYVQDGHEWSRETLVRRDLEQAHGFHIDLIEAMPNFTVGLDFDNPYIEADDFLVTTVND